MNARRELAAAALMVLLAASDASGALTLSLTPSFTELGPSGGVVAFTGSVIGDAGEALLAYDAFHDIVGIDLNAGPGPVTISDPAPVAFGNTFFSSLIPAGAGRDFGFSNTGLVTSLDTTGGLDLYTFNATFAPNVTANPIDYVIDFNPMAAGFALTLEGGVPVDLPSVTYNGATVRVNAVPEPGVIPVIGLMICGAARHLRKKRRNNKSSEPLTAS